MRLIDADELLDIDAIAKAHADIGYEQGYRDGCAEAEPRWIPCSERLPEKDGRYLVTYFWQAEGKIYETDSSLFVIVEDDDDYWDFDNVVAWMPLPEPYSEVEE